MRDRFSRARQAAIAGLVGVLLTGCAGSGGTVTGNSDDGYYGAVLAKPYSTPEVNLTDTEGQPYDLASDPTKPLTLVFFGYTHCPDICQAVMAALASALARLDEEQRSQISVVFVTTDPARDDENALRAYLDRFDPTFEGLTGPLSGIVEAAKAYGVFVEKGQKLPTGGYDVNHGTPVLGLGEDHRVRIVWTEGTSSAQYAADLIKFLDDGPPSPIGDER